MKVRNDGGLEGVARGSEQDSGDGGTWNCSAMEAVDGSEGESRVSRQVTGELSQ